MGIVEAFLNFYLFILAIISLTLLYNALLRDLGYTENTSSTIYEECYKVLGDIFLNV